MIRSPRDLVCALLGVVLVAAALQPGLLTFWAAVPLLVMVPWDKFGEWTWEVLESGVAFYKKRREEMEDRKRMCELLESRGERQ